MAGVAFASVPLSQHELRRTAPVQAGCSVPGGWTKGRCCAPQTEVLGTRTQLRHTLTGGRRPDGAGDANQPKDWLQAP